MSGKQVNQCIHFHNSGKERQILTKYCINNVMSNCKQISVSVKSASVSRSYIKFSEVTQKHEVSTICMYKHVTVQGKSQMYLKSVQNILIMLECKLKDVNVTACLLHQWLIDHLVEMFALFDQTRLQLGYVMTLFAVHMLLQLPADPVIYWAEVRTVGWSWSWSDEVWCFKG